MFKSGDGTSADRATPTLVTTPDDVVFTQVSAGSYHSLAIDADGSIYAWGQNGSGQLGDGTYTSQNKLMPVYTPSSTEITQVNASYYFSLAIDADGNAYAWGQNGGGQLGDGSNLNQSRPTPVDTPNGAAFTQLSTGFYHSLAIDTGGNIYSWGHNYYGQLGDSSTGSRNRPKLMDTADVAFTQISGGNQQTFAVGADGKTYAWGYNGNGQLGDGTTLNRNVPVALEQGVVNVTGVSFGGTDAVSFTRNADNTVTAVTPAHVSGAVDVMISWTLDDVAQDPIVFPQGFTYLVDPPTVSDPVDQTVTDGDTAVFTVTATGVESVAREFSADAGTVWQPITAEQAAMPAADGLSLTVVGDFASNNGNQYRATVTNSTASVSSRAASLIVNARAHVVSFDTQGGTSVPEVTVVHGDPVTAPADPTRDGYTFTAWYADQDASEAYDFDTPVTAEVTLYAGWQQVAVVQPPAATTPSSGFLAKTGGTLPSWLPVTAVVLLVVGTGLMLARRVTQLRSR